MQIFGFKARTLEFRANQKANGGEQSHLDGSMLIAEPALHGYYANDASRTKHRLAENCACHGRGALGVVGTGQLPTEETYTLGKLVQLGFGTSNNYGNTNLCMASAVSGYELSFGSDGPPGSYEDLETADVILLIGANIADNHPILCERLQRNQGLTLIVPDSRVTKLP